MSTPVLQHRDALTQSGNDRASGAWLRALVKTSPIAKNSNLTFPTLIEELAERFGSAPALLSDEECFTYADLAIRCRQYARWAIQQDLSHGDVVCLFLPNCPDYMAIWLGLSRLGVVTALLNTALSGLSLIHAINTVRPRHVIAGPSLADAVAAVLPRLDFRLRCWVHGEEARGFARLDLQAAPAASTPIMAGECRPPTISDQALYIYTSGTTGLPKAARVSHFRVMQWSHWFAGMMDTQPTDRMYNCLPMYHSIGGVVATGAVLVNGGSVVIRSRFSATRFWDEVIGWNCTLFQYIGELCRYLVNNPPHPSETSHHLRLCCGNGLGVTVWRKFQERFRIPRILEFYAATEGVFSLYNCEGQPGAIGRIPRFLAHRAGVAIVKVDQATGEPVRARDGFCVACGTDETGEALGKLDENADVFANRFEGYLDPVASSAKILRNVFTQGDTWFRTGDLMRRDCDGHYYFVDRIGDTFRWKGETVSTTEVADVIAAFPGVNECVVYGVSCPGAEGRAGMAAITIGREFDLQEFRHYLIAQIPAFARPVFLRVCPRIELTDTFKPRRYELAGEGFDPAASPDAIYLNDKTSESFVPLDRRLYDRIRSGAIQV
ncbi:MAG: long-chain-acyl-CoA synthetase [Acetobacteraceae bacterium]|nr:long-chain-acyl-CoA synthetase [Acetobacteraceae bacterium]